MAEEGENVSSNKNVPSLGEIADEGENWSSNKNEQPLNEMVDERENFLSDEDPQLNKLTDEENLHSNEEESLSPNEESLSPNEEEQASSGGSITSKRSTSISDYLSSPEEEKEADETVKDFEECDKIHRHVTVERIPDSLEIVYSLTADNENRRALKAALKITAEYTRKGKVLSVTEKGLFIESPYDADEEKAVTDLHVLTNFVNTFSQQLRIQSPDEQSPEPVYYEPDVAMYVNVTAEDECEENQEQDDLAMYFAATEESEEQEEKEEKEESVCKETCQKAQDFLPKNYRTIKRAVRSRHSPDDPEAPIATAGACEQKTKENENKSVTDENREKGIERDNGNTAATPAEQEKFTGAIPKKKRNPDPDRSSK